MVTDKTPQDAKKNLETIMQYYCEEMILTFEPNSRRSYSPIAAFDAIAYVIELISEREIGEYMKEKIFAPLNMTDTTFELTPQQTARLSAVYDLKDGIVPVSKKFTGSFEGFPLSYHAGRSRTIFNSRRLLQFCTSVMQRFVFLNKYFYIR